MTECQVLPMDPLVSASVQAVWNHVTTLPVSEWGGDNARQVSWLTGSMTDTCLVRMIVPKSKHLRPSVWRKLNSLQVVNEACTGCVGARVPCIKAQIVQGEVRYGVLMGRERKGAPLNIDYFERNAGTVVANL